MLCSLHIENIAVIKCADIDFPAGFTVLTGETGAGKSIIIDSLGLICGAKQSRDMIRSGEDTAQVAAVFGELPQHIFEEMSHFFTVYKNLENKETAVNEVSGYKTSIEIIDKAINSYIEKFCR